MQEQATINLGPDEHIVSLLGAGRNEALKVKMGCASGEDIAVSQIKGCFVQELEDGVVEPRLGPLLIDCAKHGFYLGLFLILPTGEVTETGASISMPILMIPCPNAEYARNINDFLIRAQATDDVRESLT